MKIETDNDVGHNDESIRSTEVDFDDENFLTETKSLQDNQPNFIKDYAVVKIENPFRNIGDWELEDGKSKSCDELIKKSNCQEDEGTSGMKNNDCDYAIIVEYIDDTKHLDDKPSTTTKEKNCIKCRKSYTCPVC